MPFSTTINQVVTISASVLMFACSSSKIMISGQIVDQTGIPIPLAEVVTEPPTDVVSTNEDGYFFLTRQVGSPEGELEIKPGAYKIKVNKLGFVNLSIPVKATKGRVWANRHILRQDQPKIDVIAPDQTEDPNSVTHNGMIMEGI